MAAKILIADDDAITLRMLQSTLRSHHYECLMVNNGRDALQHLLNDPQLQLAIIDWMMPDLDGLQICQQLRTSRQAGLKYILLLTSKAGTENMVTALQSGANDFISKPFKREELLARLKVAQRIIHLQTQLLQAHKMQSVAQLACGLAHEINTPSQYLQNNLTFLNEAFEDMQSVCNQVAHLVELIRAGKASKNDIQQVTSAMAEYDLDYLSQEIPNVLTQSRQGIGNITAIVKAMNNFAAVDAAEKQAVNINDNIHSVVKLTAPQWQSLADVELNLAENLPDILCSPSDFNQSFLHLLNNAVEAVIAQSSLQSDYRGFIEIATRCDKQSMTIQICDNGCGILPEYYEKIFDPFFSTKTDVIGVGQGLSSAYAFFVEQQHGQISFDSNVNKGTTFTVQLPFENNTDANG